MTERPNLLVASTVFDATLVKSAYPEFSSWHIMTPRTNRDGCWLYARYIWTPEAKELPPRVRWELRQRLRPCIDEHSEEQEFPSGSGFGSVDQ